MRVAAEALAHSNGGMEIEPPEGAFMPAGQETGKDDADEAVVGGGFDIRKQLGGWIRGTQLRPFFGSNVANFSIDNLQDPDPQPLAADYSDERVYKGVPSLIRSDAAHTANEAELANSQEVDASALAELRARLGAANAEADKLQRALAKCEVEKKKLTLIEATNRAEAEKSKAQEARLAVSLASAKEEIERWREAARAARAEVKIAADSKTAAETELRELSASASASRTGADDVQSLSRLREKQLHDAEARAAKAEARCARQSAEAMALARRAHDLETAAKDARSEANDLRARLDALRAAKSEVPAEEPVVVQAENDERLHAPNEAELRAEQSGLETERRLSEVRRRLGVAEARCARLSAERDAARGEAAAAVARCSRLTTDLDDAQDKMAKTMRQTEQVKTKQNCRIDDIELRRAEERSEAARRQVVALDRALDAAEARHAAACAVRDSDVAELQNRLRAANDEILYCREELDRSRSRKAFFFSGQLKQELQRLERANDVLLKLSRGEHPQIEEEHVGPAVNNKSGVATELVTPRTDARPEFDARVRCEYFATTMLRAVEGPAAALAVTPVVRELLGCPHNPIAAWLEAITRDKRLATACRSAMELVLEALETARENCLHGARAATEAAAALADSALARNVADSALSNQRNVEARDKLAAEQLADMQRRLSELQASTETQRANASRAEAKAADDLQIARDQTHDLRRRLDNADAQMRRAQRTIDSMTSDNADSPEAEHARQCVLAILRESTVNGPTYNRLLPASHLHLPTTPR